MPDSKSQNIHLLRFQPIRRVYDWLCSYEMQVYNRAVQIPLLLVFLGLLFLILASTSEWPSGGEDSFAHFLIAKYAFKHPELFLNNWGKPVFTILSSPFAQFGFFGIKVFNILAAILSSYLVYLTARRLDVRFASLSIIFLIFCPIYFSSVPSGLTEILYGLLLILSIYLFLSRNFVLSSIVVSFLPFARSEGFLIILFFLFLLLVRKENKAILFLLVGPVIFNTIGFLHSGELFWIITSNPYYQVYSADILFSSGSPLVYIKGLHNYFGIPLLTLLILGFLYLIKERIWKPSKLREDYYLEQVVLLYGIFTFHLILISYGTWKGAIPWGGDVPRFVAAVVPLSAIICLHGFSTLSEFLFSKDSAKKYFAVFFSFGVALYSLPINPVNRHSLPIELGAKQETLKEVAHWYQSSDYKGRKVYLRSAYLIYLLGIDPYDPKEAEILRRSTKVNVIPKGSLIIWNGHINQSFGPELSLFTNNPDFRLIKVFKPEDPVYVRINKERYEFKMYIFLRL